MPVTAGELRAILDQYDPDDDALVILATQPTYPMQYTVSQVEVTSYTREGEEKPIVVLVEGNQSYMSGEIREAIGW